MALRASKTVAKESDIETAPLVVDQRRRTEERFRLQVDRQTKRSFATLKDAVDAGAVIKKAHPIVQVSVYDATGGVNQLVGPDGATTDEAETRKEEE
jgi:hypothetical protein